MMMNRKEFGRQQSWCNGGTERNYGISLRMVGVPAEIRTGHLPNRVNGVTAVSTPSV
jgi:hypothetical protein